MFKKPKGLVAAPLVAMTVLPVATVMGLSAERLMPDAWRLSLMFRVGARRVTLPPAVVMDAFTEALVPAFSVKFLLVSVIGALTAIFPVVAVNVRLFLPVLTESLMAVDTNTLSAVTVTADVFKPASKVPTSRLPPVDVVKFGLPETLLVVTALIVMSPGSSNQVPVAPAGALVSTRIPSTSRASFPEVSTNPPLPPTTPPLAEMLPKARVVLSAQTMTLPPSPLALASAFMLACGPK